jgi:hypothetical protein
MIRCYTCGAEIAGDLDPARTWVCPACMGSMGEEAKPSAVTVEIVPGTKPVHEKALKRAVTNVDAALVELRTIIKDDPSRDLLLAIDFMEDARGRIKRHGHDGRWGE